MAQIDEMINDWLLEKFFWSGQYDKAKHGTIKSVKVLSVDMGWDCGCYSEFTRDDSFELTGRFTSDRGEFTWAYGRWGDLPTFIEELDAYQDRYCPYDEREDPWT
jgi:hypothetical protein